MRIIASVFAAALLCAPLLCSSETLDETVVNGKRINDLRKEMTKAEDRFFSAYNRLNRLRDYSVDCENSASTGTRLTQRSCVPHMVNKANEEEARNFLGSMQDNQGQIQQKEENDRATQSQLSGRAAAGDASAAGQLAAAGNTSTENINDARQAGVSADVMIAPQKGSFEQHLQDMIDQYPELRKLADEYTAARQRYEQARKAHAVAGTP